MLHFNKVLVKTACRAGSDIKHYSFVFFVFFLLVSTTVLHCGAIVLYDLHPTLIV